MKNLFPLLSLFLSVTAFSQTPITSSMAIHFDCYLPSDQVSCEELRSSLLTGGISSGSESDSLLSLTLRSLPLNNSVEYQFTLKGQGELPDIDFKYPLNDSLSPGERFEKVLSMMNKLIEPYKLIINFNPEAGGKEKSYYLSPSIGSFGSSGQGDKSFLGYGELNATIWKGKWRIVGDIGGRYAYSSSETTAFSPGIETKTFRHGAGVGIIRSITKRWSLAVLAYDIRVSSDVNVDSENHGLHENALHNEARKANIVAGAEWILVPTLTDESNGNVAVQYYIGGEHHKYVDPQSYEYIKEEFAKHTLALVVSKHFKKVDVDLTTSAFRSQLRPQVYTGLSGFSKVSYKINKSITLDVSGNVEYAKGRVPSPAAGSSSFVSLTNGDKSSLTYSGSVGVRFNVGNNRRKNKDQRFKH